MKIIVISLEDAEARRTRLDASLTSLGLSYHWIKAVDARNWTDADMAPYLNQSSLFLNAAYHPIPGSVGCYLSHLDAYRHLLASDDEAVLILEDDAEVTADLPHHLPALEKAAQALDVIFLCDRRKGRFAKFIGGADTGLTFHFKRYSNIGAFGYVINRKAASLIVERHAKFGPEIDLLLNRWWQTHLNVATTTPDLVTHEHVESQIGYNDISYKKNILQRSVKIMHSLLQSLYKRATYNAHYKTIKRAYAEMEKHD